MSTMLPQPTGAMLPQPQQRMAKNPMLPQMPQTGEVDSTYLAEEAQLRAQIAKQYADILQQLGWVDESGNFMPGQISVNAARQGADLERQSGLAEQGVTEEAQRGGTLFSGRRATETAKAQQPFQRQIAQLGVDTPMALGAQYENAAGLIDQYTLQNNLFLAQMAARRAQAIAQQPAGAPRQQGQGGGEGEDIDPASLDYSGGPNSIFQPAADVGALMKRDQDAGQWDAWERVMAGPLGPSSANMPQAPPPRRRPGGTSQGFRGIL
jgi:hypothetical protein